MASTTKARDRIVWRGTRTRLCQSENAALLELGSLELDRARLRAGEHERNRIDEAAGVGRGEIAMRRKHGRFKQDEPAFGEVERACRPALVVRKIDDNLA